MTPLESALMGAACTFARDGKPGEALAIARHDEIVEFAVLDERRFVSDGVRLAVIDSAGEQAANLGGALVADLIARHRKYAAS